MFLHRMGILPTEADPRPAPCRAHCDDLARFLASMRKSLSEQDDIPPDARAFVLNTSKMLEHEAHRRCLEHCLAIPVNQHPLL